MCGKLLSFLFGFQFFMLKRAHYFNEAVAPVQKARTTTDPRLFQTHRGHVWSATLQQWALPPRWHWGGSFFLSTCVGNQNIVLLRNEWTGPSHRYAAGPWRPWSMLVIIGDDFLEWTPRVPGGLHRASLRLSASGENGRVLMCGVITDPCSSPHDGSP